MLKLKIKLEEGVKVPYKATEGAMCWDCYAWSIKVNENGKTEVDLGFSLEPPVGYGIRIIPRSNLTKYWWVLNNSFGVGDQDYRGNYKAIFTPLPMPNYTNTPNHYPTFPYSVNDRVCQMELYRKEDFEFEQVENLSDTVRGGGGFGSTNLK